MARGGYRKPMNPAPVSGPGSLSQRTDGGPADKQAARYISGLPYGEGQAMMDIQNSAPMAAAPSIEQSNMPSGLASAAASQQPIVGLNAPTTRAGEPVTAGANAGPGPDMSVLGLGQQDQTADNNYRATIATYMPALMFLASRPNVSSETRNVIRQLREYL